MEGMFDFFDAHPGFSILIVITAVVCGCILWNAIADFFRVGRGR